MDRHCEGVDSRGAGIKNGGPERMQRIGRMQEQRQLPDDFIWVCHIESLVAHQKNTIGSGALESVLGLGIGCWLLPWLSHPPNPLHPLRPLRS